MKLNVLLITNLYPNPEEPNRGIFVKSLVRELKNSCEITIVSPLPWFPQLKCFRRFKSWYKFSLIPNTYFVDGLEVLSPKYLAIPKIGFTHTFFLWISMLPKIRRIIREKKIDVINAHWLFPDGVVSQWIAKYLKVPVVLTAHGTDINLYLKMKLRAKQIKGSLKDSEAIIVVSEEHRIILEQFITAPRVKVIPNGYDASFYVQDKTRCRNELGLKLEGKTIIFIGRLVKVKGFPYLIKAIELLEKRQLNHYELNVVGDGPLRSTFEKEVDSFGLAKKIKFHGEKAHSEIHKWIAASDVMCLPSTSEGCPTAVIEALACGRPVVASKVGELPKLISQGNGLLFEPGDVEQLSVALQKALTVKWEENVIRNSVIHLTWTEIAKKYSDIYQEVTANCL